VFDLQLALHGSTPHRSSSATTDVILIGDRLSERAAREIRIRGATQRPDAALLLLPLLRFRQIVDRNKYAMKDPHVIDVL
jgi:hypothetical protein